MSDFGGKLRLARERRGLSLRQIAAKTKISIAALEALERNDISRLPGGIFSRSFVRSYAIEVGLDPDDTIHQFLEEFHGSPATEIPTSATAAEAESAFDERQRLAGVFLKVVIVTIPLILLVFYFTMRVRQPASALSPPSPPPAAGDSQPQHTGPAAAASTPAAVATSGAVRPTGVDGALVLDVETTNDCWVKVITDGKVTVERLMRAGDKERVEARDRALIRVGNAGAFTFTVNGVPAKPLGPAGSVRTAIITKDTLSRYLQ